MSLREWIEQSVGVVGTRAQLEAFETQFLEGCEQMRRDGLSSPEDAICEPSIWRIAYDLWAGLTHGSACKERPGRVNNEDLT